MKNTPTQSKHSDTLVLIIHGLRGSQHSVADLKKLALESYPNATVCAPTFAYSSLTSMQRATDIVHDIIHWIDNEFVLQDFEKVIFIGHSMGAVLARRVLIEASGLSTAWPDANSPNPAALQVEPSLQGITKRDWANKVDLLVFMASISRGWSIEHAQSGWQTFQWNLGGMFGHMLPPKWKPTLFDFRKGSPFIVQTRLRWLEYCKANKQKRPHVFQFLGTTDEVAPPNDTIDFATECNGEKFTQIEVPASEHKSILNLYGDNADDQNSPQANRREIIKAVLLGNKEIYQKHRVKRAFVLDELPPDPDPLVNNVIFVVHGIRDKGYWTKKVAARVKQEAEIQGTTFVSRTPGYGYFPIWRFLLPWYRRQKTEWLMDHYVEAAATYQEADFHYMGHSNGTYLCARALMDYPMASFKHVMFAGSVVHPDFAWKDYVQAGRVSKILNLVASKDLVVAIFPNGLRFARKLFDLGGAGHLGFSEKSLPNNLFQMDHERPMDGLARDYVKGGHTAPRAEGLWDEIATFIVNGTPPPSNADHPLFKTSQSLAIQKIGLYSPIIVAAIALFVVALGLFVTHNFAISTGFIAPPDISTLGAFKAYLLCKGPAWNTGILAVYALVVRFMALRF
jgi:alpha-beta hydrolase superfamily lysophospholipase